MKPKVTIILTSALGVLLTGCAPSPNQADTSAQKVPQAEVVTEESMSNKLMADRSQLDDDERKLVEDVENVGWHVIAIEEDDEGRVYTFAKTPNETPFNKAVMRLIWFSADDLSYKKDSFFDLAIPPDDDGNHLVVAGGPHILGDVFFVAMTEKVDGKPARMNEIGRFSLKTGKYLGAIHLDYWYVRPQALAMDGDRNFYVMETRGHLKKFSPSGKYLGTVFEGAVPAIYEGFFLDSETNKATVSITKGSRDHGEEGRGIFIVGISLKNGE